MVPLNNIALVGIFFAGIFAAILIYVGVLGIQNGRRALARLRIVGEQVVWHRQTAILFGINNIVFALLIVFVVLLSMFADRTLRYIMIALVVLTLLSSILLVVRCISVAMQTVNSPRKQ